MIFIANVLELNGGTTFLVRTCRALQAAGRPCAVLVLRPGGDAKLADELSLHARIFHMGDFQLDRARMWRKQLSSFAPIYWRRLAEALAPFGHILHAMGAFGLIAGARLCAHKPAFRVTVGVYHQNEFIYQPSRFFSADVLKLFRRLPPENILFFNELSRDNYIRFHAQPGYSASTIAPIGITVPSHERPAERASKCRVVSVGNLVAFKTYNRHVIALLPKLSRSLPDISYHVYGSGDQLDALRAQATSLGIGDRVVFHGSVSYDRLPAIWAETDLFVGSGTALIEAASAGVPALVGVESIEQPLTYGYLSDIQGLSYNELGADLPLQPMDACISHVLQDPAEWRSVADACRRKAREFSVERTAEGLLALAEGALRTSHLLTETAALRMLTALPLLQLRDRLFPQTAFAQRRNQSFKG